ncbi:MAG: hypothetical protein ACK5NY_00880 [Burkholderiaceae bacterium]
MDAQQFDLLQADLARLCEQQTTEGSYSIDGLSFKVDSGAAAGVSWVDMMVDVMPLGVDDGLEAMSAALDSNVSLLRSSPYPIYFGLAGHTPDLVLVQRIYGSAFSANDVLQQLRLLAERIARLRQNMQDLINQ